MHRIASPNIPRPNEHASAGSSGVQERPPRSGPFFADASSSREPESRPSVAAALFFPLGRLFFGIALLVFGIQEFQYAGHVPDLGLIPAYLPAHLAASWIAGSILLLGGLAILLRIQAPLACFLLGIVFFVSALLRFPPLHPAVLQNVSARTVFFELLSCGAACWMLVSLFSKPAPPLAPAITSRDSVATTGRILFGIANIVFGVDHFQVASFIASLIPHWMPAHLFLAYFTGAAFIAAGVAIAARLWVRLSAVLLALMYFLWVVTLHAPRIAQALHNGDEWNSGFVCLAMSGCALIVAALPGRPAPDQNLPLASDPAPIPISDYSALP